MRSLGTKAILYAVFCNILFGSAFPAIKIGYQLFGIGESVFQKILFAGIRFFISGIVVLLFETIRCRSLPRIPKENGRNILLLAITYTFLQYIFFYVGLSNTTGASGSVVSSTSVFMSVILSHFIYKNDKMSLRKLIGSIIGFAGVVIACFATGKANGVSFIGEGFICFASLFFVIGSVINKKATAKSSCYNVSGYNLLIGGALLIAVGAIGTRESFTVTVSGVLVLLYLVMVSSIGFTLWSYLLRSYPLGTVSVFAFVIPISGTILSGIFLTENIFTWQYALSLVLVSIGISAVNKHKSINK